MVYFMCSVVGYWTTSLHPGLLTGRFFPSYPMAACDCVIQWHSHETK